MICDEVVLSPGATTCCYRRGNNESRIARLNCVVTSGVISGASPSTLKTRAEEHGRVIQK